MCLLANLFLLLFLFPSKTTAQICSAATCGINTLPIRFPFWIERWQPESCGYPGFNISCSGAGGTVLKLSNSGEFHVRGIDYSAQRIELLDPQGCLASRLLQLNLSGSPFFPQNSVEYTFLDCPGNFTSEFSIPCLSNSTNTVIATPRKVYAKSISTICNVRVTLAVPAYWPGGYDGVPSNDLNKCLQLIWLSPNCFNCEAKGGLCGYKSNTNKEIDCFRDPNAGHSSKELLIIGIISVSLVLPAIIFTIVMGCCACRHGRRNGVAHRINLRQGNTATVTPQPTVVTIGLDESTIASFSELVLGESRRLPGPNDNTCPICLSEYQPKETLRCIPECRHCFHAECLDEWLRMNITCPVCRNCPSPIQNSELTQL